MYEPGMEVEFVADQDTVQMGTIGTVVGVQSAYPHPVYVVEISEHPAGQALQYRQVTVPEIAIVRA